VAWVRRTVPFYERGILVDDCGGLLAIARRLRGFEGEHVLPWLWPAILEVLGVVFGPWRRECWSARSWVGGGVMR
jgi:hypothetical protein